MVSHSAVNKMNLTMHPRSKVQVMCNRDDRLSVPGHQVLQNVEHL